MSEQRFLSGSEIDVSEIFKENLLQSILNVLISAAVSY